jgi:hypothetical protein
MRAELWAAAEIYPLPANDALVLTPAQSACLALFTWPPASRPVIAEPFDQSDGA